VLKVDAETNKISLGIKSSLFDDVDVSDEEMDEGDVTDVLDPLMAESESDQDEDDSEEESDGDDIDDADEDDDDDDDDAEVSDDEEEDEESEEDSDEQMDDGESDSDDDSKESLEDSEMDDADDSEDSEDEPIGKDLGFEWDAKEANDDAALGKSTDQDSDKVALSKREKKRLREARELEILRREQALRDGDQVPESAQEFEKLLIASPRSSFLWVRYMAFHVSCGAYEEAKEVAERAIVAIPASEESERMNVWAAYLNLENKYGTPSPEEAVQKLFKRAVQIANAKHMYMTLISMYERNGQDEALEENLKKAVKKFSYSLKVWMAYIRTNVLKGDSEAARKLLDRATQALPKHKHIKLLMRTALLEMKEGNPGERTNHV
jgi:rRNA biogenesis protein RRP5